MLPLDKNVNMLEVTNHFLEKGIILCDYHCNSHISPKGWPCHYRYRKMWIKLLWCGHAIKRNINTVKLMKWISK